jgi:hypothetical protein
MSRALPTPGSFPGGFVAIPRRTLDLLLCLPLTRRELSVLLLVARLTYGCRNAAWARLLQADLTAVGIGAGHARAALEGLISRGFLERRNGTPEYRFGNLEGGFDAGASDRTGRLKGLVAAQLSRGYPDGKGSVTREGIHALPKREIPPYRNGNASTVPAWRFDRSQGRFLEDTAAPIDKERHRKTC